jgi:hypothetical protein
MSNRKRDYDSTVARIAGNIVPGLLSIGRYELREPEPREMLAETAVAIARAIVAEVKRTEP